MKNYFKARNIDEYYAIQCKFYDDEHSVSKSDVDTFLTASGKPFYISELTLDDSVKILGCLNGLSKKTLFESEENYFENDPYKMKRAVAFCSDIKGSKKFVQLFGEIQDEIKMYGADDDLVSVELRHVDGTQNALCRKESIDWLKEDTQEGTCRILSNARCLSEGIDVPALDAVMFLNPRNSIVDIIQSVGRVMRKTDGKNYGYIILPIGIPAGVEPEEALGDNKKYKIVWDVLQALRAHDDRFNNTINKIELNRKKPQNIQIIGVTGRGEDNSESDINHEETYRQLTMKFDELQNEIHANEIVLLAYYIAYPCENIIASNYILADTQAFLDKRHRQQNKEILIRHSPGIGECFFVFKYSINRKNKKIFLRGL